MAQKKDPPKKGPTVQVRISEDVFTRLDLYASHQRKKVGRRVQLQEIATEAVDEYLKKHSA